MIPKAAVSNQPVGASAGLRSWRTVAAASKSTLSSAQSPPTVLFHSPIQSTSKSAAAAKPLGPTRGSGGWCELPIDLIRENISFYLLKSQDACAFRRVCFHWSRAMLLPDIHVNSRRPNNEFLGAISKAKRLYLDSIPADLLTQVARNLTDSSVVEVLHFTRCEFDHAGMEQICTMIKVASSMKSLALTCSALREQNMRLLSGALKASHLSGIALDLSFAQLTENELVLLFDALNVKHSCVRSLSLHTAGKLGSLKASEALLELLSSPNCVLETLNLWQCNLDDPFFSRFAKILSVNSTLKSLDFGCNSVEKSIKDLVDAITQNRTLEHLGLASSFTKQPLSHFAEVLSKNPVLTSLDLSGFSFASQTALEFANALATNTTLRVLTLDSCNLYPDLFRIGLSRNKSVETLDILGGLMIDSSVQAVAAALAENTTLRTLKFNPKPLHTDKVTVEAARLFGNALANQKRCALEVLVVESWRRVAFDGHFQHVLNALAAGGCGLKIMDFHGLEIGDAGGIAIAKAIMKSPRLEEIDLSNCSIGLAPLIAIFESAAQSKTIQKLNFSLNDIISSNEAFSKSVSAAIKQCPSLTHLNMEGMNLHAGVAMAVAKAAGESGNLSYLNVRNNSFGSLALGSLQKLKEKRQGQLRLIIS